MLNINVDIYVLILALNVAVFLLFGYDKLMAKKKGWRIPEALLFIGAVAFGGLGALFGMVVFNHKTSKIAFRIFVPPLVLINYYFAKNDFQLLKLVLKKLLNIIP